MANVALKKDIGSVKAHTVVSSQRNSNGEFPCVVMECAKTFKHPESFRRHVRTVDHGGAKIKLQYNDSKAYVPDYLSETAIHVDKRLSIAVCRQTHTVLKKISDLATLSESVPLLHACLRIGI
jgi:hypothetical protein